MWWSAWRVCEGYLDGMEILTGVWEGFLKSVGKLFGLYGEAVYCVWKGMESVRRLSRWCVKGIWRVWKCGNAV